MMFALRPASREDTLAIRTLIRLGRLNPTGLDWRRFVLATAQDGKIIGCGQIKPHADGCYELASIVVTPAWRGRGVARAIIQTLLARHQRQMPHVALHLMCRSALVPLYEKFGFRAIPENEMPPYFRRISRLINLFHAVRRDSERLVVMKHDGVG